MNKKILLTFSLTMCISGSVFAANPFSDVPRDHWAYAAVSRLATSGVVDGVGNNTFQGDRNITRYEAAQMVAKAMAQGVNSAELNKLSTEFAEELNSLGVRVQKLESKVQISGEMRLRFRNASGDNKNGAKAQGSNDLVLRTRLFMNGTINKNWKAGLMLENSQVLNTNNSFADEGTVSMRRAFAAGKYDRLQIQLGRIEYTDYQVFYWNNTEIDGIRLDYKINNNLNVFGIYGRASTAIGSWTGDSTNKNGARNSLGLNLDYQNNRLRLLGSYWHIGNDKKEDVMNNKLGTDMYYLTASYNIGKMLTVSGSYVHTSLETQNSGKNGFIAMVSYGKLNMTKPGTWNVYTKYYQLPGAAIYSSGPQGDLETPIANGTAVNPFSFSQYGWKGYNIGADYVIAKNMRLHTSWISVKAKDANNKAKTDAFTLQMLMLF